VTATHPRASGTVHESAAPIATVTVVHAPACHFCADARSALAELGGEFPIRTALVEAAGAAGAALVAAHRPVMFPLVLVDGAFFSAGRLPRRKLRALLAGRSVVSRS
jgi:glutaredoxin